jgi:dolichyl-phosphate beta-glucosyltransferase
VDFSIVIPALNEQDKIAADIEAAAAFLADSGLEGEIIVVDDGSTDGTANRAESTRPALPPRAGLKIIRHERRLGKGNAVRTGITQSSGKFVLFADSGCCVPYRLVPDGLEMLRNGLCDIAHGSRKLRTSRVVRGQGLYRRICSALFHLFVVVYMGIPSHLTDTQCGFKLYDGRVARKLYGECRSPGFAFDIEIILRAIKAGYRIREFAIEWTCDRDSRLRPAHSAANVLAELVGIKRTVAS